MSSGDELAGYNPTTPGPAQARKQPAPKPVPRPVPRPVAGPSKAQKSAPAKKTAPKNVEPIVIDQDPDVTMISSDEDEAPARKTTTNNKGKGKSAQSATAQTNGAANTKARGKAKSQAASKTSEDAMEVEMIDVADPGPVPAAVRPAKGRPNPAKASPTVDTKAIFHREKREMEALKRENERLRKRLEDANAHSKKLSEQMESLMKIRQTEPETLLAERVAQYEATTQAQERLIQEQTEQLAQLKVLAESGRHHTVPFLSREEADAEKRGLEHKLKALNEAAKQKDAQIATLKTDNKELQIQLEEEIKMAKAQKSNQPDLVSKSDVLVELYERLTNFMVVDIKRSKFRLFDLPETKFRCIFTHYTDPTGGNNEGDAHISFDLMDTWARKDETDSDEVTSQDELEQKTMYIPLDLHMQKPELLERLGFFTEQFLFTPSQMTVFLRTLQDCLNKKDDEVDQLHEDQSEKDDDTVEVMVS